jgi:arylsulfatase A-like enzyme
MVRINKPETMQGNSLLSLIRGEEQKHSSFFSFSEYYDQFLSGKTVECIRTNEWKLICINEENKLRYELYNLKLDPEEKNNLVDIKSEEFKFLNERLSKWRNRVPLFKPILSETTKETKEKLRSLGYIQ